MKICYFGINFPIPCPRDKVYLDGLRSLGVEISECIDRAPSFYKFINLVKKYRSLRDTYDLIWVGYLSGIVVPLAKILSSKKVVFNALNSMYESNILDQRRHSIFSPMALLFWFADFLAFHMADLVLVETEEQRKFLSKLFLVKKSKLHVVMTGIDESVFYQDSTINKRSRFTVVFRGWFVNATGIETVLETAKVMKTRDREVDFLMIGRGQLQNMVNTVVTDNKLDNVKIIQEYLSGDQLRDVMLSCHVMLGPFSSHSRMDRTIQNKTIEALALGMPYIVRDSKSNRELLKDQENCLFVRPDSPTEVADKILELKNNDEMMKRLSHNARTLFEQRLTSSVLGKQIFDLIVSLSLS